MLAAQGVDILTLDDLIGRLAQICKAEGIEAERAALEIVARRGEGSVRDSLSLLDQVIAFSGRVGLEAVSFEYESGRPVLREVELGIEPGETVLLHLEGQTYYSLNATGTQIWQGIKQGLTLQAISQQLQATYAVEPTYADHSVLALVEELLQQLLVQRGMSDTPRAQAT